MIILRVGMTGTTWFPWLRWPLRQPKINFTWPLIMLLSMLDSTPFNNL